jgi:hypothetical protein
VRRLLLFVFLGGCGLIFSGIEARSEGLSASQDRFYYRTPAGPTSARIIRHYWNMPVFHPDARVDERLIGALILAPALLDAWRYFHPDARWAAWTSRGVKVGMVVMIVR